MARLWLASLRVRVVVDPGLDAASGRPWVLVFWHGSQFPLYAWPRRRRTAALVSLSRDGEILAGAMRVLGLDVVRGSSSRGGAQGLLALIGALGRGTDVAVAVDGPRGPARTVRRGAAAAALAGGAVLVPIAAACERSWLLSSWDRFELPVPFSRVAVALGPPLDPDRLGDGGIERALASSGRQAEKELPRARETAKVGS